MMVVPIETTMFRLASMLPQIRRGMGVAGLGLVAFVLTHQLVFLNTYGAGTDAALVRTGHGGGWTLTELAAIGMAVALSIAAAAELIRLSRRARAVEGTVLAGSDQPLGDLLRPLLLGWLWLALLGAVLFTLSENVEHTLIGAPLPGLGVFGSAEYAGTLPILLTVSLCVAGLRALYGWRRAALVARLQRTRPRLQRPDVPTVVQRPRDDDRRPSTYIGGGFAKRAPPRCALV